MRRLPILLAGALLALALSAAPASAAFGLHDLDATFTDAAGAPAMAAGTHPFAFTTKLKVNTVGVGAEEGPDGAVKDLIFDVPAGMAVNPSAVPTCSAADFAITGGDGNNNCPNATAVGTIGALGEPGNPNPTDFGAIYNLKPPPGVAARFGFRVLSVQLGIEGGVRPEGEFNAFAQTLGIAQAEPFFGAIATLWGTPSDPRHNSQRGKCLLNKGSCPVEVNEKAFLTLPTRCTGPLRTTFKADPWQQPGAFFEETILSHDDAEPPAPVGPTDCAKVRFTPDIAAAPTNASAESPSGLDFDLDINDEGLTSPSGTAQSQMKKTVVTLPPGVTINPSQAEGLGVCSEAGFKREAADSEPGRLPAVLQDRHD